MTIKRVGLYFNLDIPQEAMMWAYLQDKKKSYELKKGLELLMQGNGGAIAPSGPTFKPVDINEVPKIELEKKEIHIDKKNLDNEAINF